VWLGESLVSTAWGEVRGLEISGDTVSSFHMLDSPSRPSAEPLSVAVADESEPSDSCLGVFFKMIGVKEIWPRKLSGNMASSLRPLWCTLALWIDR